MGVGIEMENRGVLVVTHQDLPYTLLLVYVLFCALLFRTTKKQAMLLS